MRIFEAIQFVAYEVREKTLIIIPTYNERENIGLLLTQITQIVPGADVVVVDDCSPDGTGAAVTGFCKENPGSHVHLLERAGERGLGYAYRAGLRFGLERGYEVLVTMDADMSHNPLHLPALLNTLEGNDMVIGSRYIRDGGTINWRIRRILLSWLANRFARFLLGLKGGDLTSGYRAYRRGILETIGLDQVKSNGYSYLVEMLFRVQRGSGRVTEVPILFYDRTMGRSKISRREIYRGVFTLLRLRLSGTKKKKNHDKK